MSLNGLDRDEELLGNFLVLIAASDEPHHLALARAEPIQLLVDHGDLASDCAKGIKDETCQPGAEHGIAVRDATNGAGQVGTVDRLLDVSASPSPDDGDLVLRRIG